MARNTYFEGWIFKCHVDVTYTIAQCPTLMYFVVSVVIDQQQCSWTWYPGFF